MSSVLFANVIIPDEVWKHLLSPLSLIDDLRLETVCKAFSRTIYCSQFRFVWCKEFQDYLYRKYKINRTQKDANQFLEAIAHKIGPYCNQVICKLYVFPINYKEIFPKFPKMVSLYLKLYKKEGVAELSVKSNQDVFPSFRSASNAEFRLFIVDPEKDYFKNENFKLLENLEKNLISIQLWRTENSLASKLTMLNGLRKLRIQVDENVVVLFSSMVANLTKLEQLYISWNVHKVTASIVKKLSEAMNKLTKLRALSLEIDWNIFKFSDDCEKQAFVNEYYCFADSITPTLQKMSLNVQHLNFRAPLMGSAMLHSITYARALKYLRIVADVKDVFPLKFEGFQGDTFELVFNYVKLYRQIAPFLCNSEYHSTLLPAFFSETRFIFDIDQYVLPSVTTLKLKHCPVFSTDLSDHISAVFGDNLEKIYFQAYHESTYTSYADVNGDGEQNIAFIDVFLGFVYRSHNLRVVKFGDKFNKKKYSKTGQEEKNFDELVEAFIERAKQNPEMMYCLYIDKMQNCSVQCLKQSAELKNLRVF